MTDILFTNAIVYVDGHTLNRWLHVRDDKIVSMGRHEPPQLSDAQVIDAQGMHLLPGFIDVHVHGGANADTMDGKAESLQTMAKFYAQHGVTSFLATTWTDTNDNITNALQAVKDNLGAQPDGATLRGVHLEGPYLDAQMAGAQNLSLIRRAERDEALAWLDFDVIRLVSLAPEYVENHWFIEECVARGVTVSAAHTAATYEDIVKAYELGLRHSTHTFNAMTKLHHREPGVVGAMLSIPDINCELIADNIHVHPAVMRLLWNAKNFQNVILISDAIRAAGMPDGEYPQDERILYVKNGVAQLENGTLAGSTLTMDRALRNFMKATGSPLDVVYEASSTTAADAVGLGDVTGRIEEGKDADIVLLDSDYKVNMTMALGKIVYQA